MDVESIRQLWLSHEETRNNERKELENQITSAVQSHKLEMLALEQRKDKECREMLAANSGGGKEGGSAPASPLVGSVADSAVLDRLSAEKDKLALEMASQISKYNALETELNKHVSASSEMKNRIAQKDAALKKSEENIAEQQKSHETDISGFEEKIIYLQMQVRRHSLLTIQNL